MISRRVFLKRGLLTAVGLGLTPGFLDAATFPLFASQEEPAVVFLFQRGGMDGLSLLPPYSDPNYLSARPSIAIKNGIPLDDQFALHPAMAPLLSHWKEKTLAFITETGSVNVSRLHASAEDIFHTLSKQTVAQHFAYPRAPLKDQLKEIARRIRVRDGLKVAIAETVGWDTHRNQGNEEGQLAHRFSEMATALQTFCDDLGPDFSRVVVVTVTEFGRSVRENAYRGTDHGESSVMLALGGKVRGGQIYGSFSKVSADNPFVPVTTDSRALVGQILLDHLRLKDLSPVFPGYSHSPSFSLVSA